MKNLLDVLRSPKPDERVPQLQEELARAEAQNFILEERFTRLELEMENMGWLRVGDEGDVNFTREFLDDIIDLSRVMYLKNPLIGRAVDVQKVYVWGQSWNVKGQDPDVNALIQSFLDDRRNREELTSQQARELKEVERATTGNLFFVFFTAGDTGRVRVRKIPPKEIREIVKNPDDRRQSWFYKRKWTQKRLRPDGSYEHEEKTVYYPDWQYRPRTRPTKIGDDRVDWDHPVLHRKSGGIEDMDFGLPDTYAALDWAKAAKQHLEDWTAVTRTLARFALALRQRGRTSMTDSKARLGTTIASGAGGPETNPPPLAGSVWMASDGADLAPFRTAGARPSPDEARRLWLMVCAAVGLPETFFGDADIGNLATAKTLDRPTELKMRSCQTLWTDTFRDIFSYVIEQAVRAPLGRLHNAATLEDVEDGDEEESVVTMKDGEDGQPRSLHVEITFPDILEHDVKARVDAIVSAATLDGKPQANTLPLRYVSEQILRAIGEDDIDEILDMLFPKDPQGNELEPGLMDPTLASPDLAGPLLASGREFVAALGTFVETLKNGKAPVT